MNKYRILAISALLIVAVAMLVLWTYMPDIMATVRQEVLKQAKANMNGALYIEKVRLTGFFELTADKVKIDDEQSQTIFQAEHIAVRVNPLTFLLNSETPLKALSSVNFLPGSKTYLVMNEQEQWNVNNILKPSDDTSTDFGALIKFNEAELVIVLPEGKWDVALNGTVDAVQNPVFELNLSVREQDNKVNVTGNVKLDGTGKLRFSSDSIAAQSFAALVKQAIAVDDFAGRVKDVDVIWQNGPNGNVFNGRLAFDQLSGKYVLDENNFAVVLAGNLSVKDNKLVFEKTNAIVNDQKIDIGGALSLHDQIPVAQNLSLGAKDFAVQNALATSPFIGNIDFSLIFDGPLNERFDGLLVKGEVQFAKVKVADVAIDSGDIVFNYKEQNFFLEKGKLGLLGGQADVIGKYDLANNYLSGSAKMRRVNLARLSQQPLAGLVNGDVHFSGSPSYEGLDFTADVASDVVYLRSLGIRNVKAGLQKSGSITLLKYASANVGGGYFTANGVVDGTPLSLEVAVADLPLADVFAAFDRDASGWLNGRIELQGSWNNLIGDANLYARDGVVEKQPFKTVQGGFALRDQLVSFDRLLLEMNYGLHYISGTVDFSKYNPELGLTIASKAVRLEPLAAFAMPEESLTGNLDSFIVLTGTTTKPNAKGELHIYEASFRGSFVEDVNGRYIYNEDGLLLDNISIKFMQTGAFLNGLITNDGKLALDFVGNNIRLENLAQYENLDIKGGVGVKGTLTGTLEKPFFNGQVKSNEIFVNGQAINNVQGEAWSEAGRNNYVRISFAQNDGFYHLDAGLDFDERFAHGLLEVTNGDVKSLIAVAGETADVGGKLNGTITLNSGGKRNGIFVDADISDARIRQIPFEKVDLKLHLHKGKFTINEFRAKQGNGSVVGQGTADMQGDLDIELGGAGLDAGILTAFMDKPVDFQGNLGFLVQLSGAFKNPQVAASMQISPGSVENVTFDNFYGLFSVKDDVFNIEQLFLARDEYKVSAYGRVPVDLLRAKENRHNLNSQMDISIRLDNADLSLIPSLFSNEVEWGMGKTEGELNIKGTLEEPEYYGGIQIKDGTLKFRYLLNPLDKINLDIDFERDKVVLQQFDAVMGQGTLKAEGSLGLKDFSGSDYHLKVQADQLAIASEMVSGPLSFDFEITPQNTYRGTLRPHIKGNVLLENLTINIPTIPEFGEGALDLGLDINIKTGRNVRLYNKYLYDILLAEGLLHVTGSTNFPSIEGNIKAQKGRIRYLNTNFRIDSATVAFPVPGSLMPTVNLTARSRISSVGIFVSVRGPLDEINLTLTSEPPMSQQEIFRLITLRTRTNDSSTLTEDDMKNLLAAGLQLTVFGNVEDFLQNTFGIDEFRIYQGSINTGIGLMVDSMMMRHSSRDDLDQYNFYIGKYLTNRILLSYTRSFSNDDSRLGIQYEINRRLSLGAAIDEDSKMYYGIEYRVSF